VTAPDDAWLDQAACKGTDPVMFSPTDWPEKQFRRRLNEAREICAVCPVADECLEETRRRPDRWMIRAGTLPEERSAAYGSTADNLIRRAYSVAELEQTTTGPISTAALMRLAKVNGIDGKRARTEGLTHNQATHIAEAFDSSIELLWPSVDQSIVDKRVHPLSRHRKPRAKKPVAVTPPAPPADPFSWVAPLAVLLRARRDAQLARIVTEVRTILQSSAA
jgi:hypothetical protein